MSAMKSIVTRFQIIFKNFKYSQFSNYLFGEAKQTVIKTVLELFGTCPPLSSSARGRLGIKFSKKEVNKSIVWQIWNNKINNNYSREKS